MMGTAVIDWNWFFSSLAQSVAALVGIFAAFIITKIINNQAEFQRKNARLKELLAVSAKFRDALFDRFFDWYNERRMEYALKRLNKIAEEDEVKEPEDYYEEFSFPKYLPRADVLKTIQDKVAIQKAKRNPSQRDRGDRSYSSRSDFPYLGSPNPEFTRFRIQQESQLRESVEDEGERIQALILEIRQHIRLVNLHLTELEGNPESSSLIGSSIIGAILLFLLGIVYPLSFLPVQTDRPIAYSVLVFFPLLLSFKGFLLTVVSLIFLAIMSIFWRANFSLRYDSSEMDRLRIAGKIENYSNYLRVMKQNEEEQRKWSEAKSKERNDLVTKPPVASP